MTRFIRPRYQSPRVWLVLPDANRLGGRWGEIDGAVSRTIDTLLGLRVEFGVLREQDIVTGVLDTPPVLIWPMPYCPDDATFAAVKKQVRKGASLYVSGDVSFDENRRPTKTGRLAELGLKLDAHPSPFQAKPPGSVQKVSIGKGRVFLATCPPELGTRRLLRDRLNEFLGFAEAPRIPVEPEDPDLHPYIVYGVGGQTLFGAVNHDQARTARFLIGDGPISISLAAPGYGLAGVDREGSLTLLQTQGSVRRGERVIVESDTDVMLLALDKRDLADSARMLVMANFAGTVEIATRRNWAQPTATVGDVISGRFKTLETISLRAAEVGARKDSRTMWLKLDIDADRALDLIVITERDDAKPATQQIVDALTLGRR